MQVAKLVLVDAQGYTEGVGEMATMPKLLAYLGVLSWTYIAIHVFHNCQSSCLNMMVSPVFELLDVLVFSRDTWLHPKL